MKIPLYEKQYEVHINDVDKNNKMKLVTFLKFMQETGALHSKEFGYGLNDNEKTHRGWVVLAWKLQILSRPVWNEKVTVKTWIGKLDKLYYYRDFEIIDENDNVIAKAVSKWIMIDTSSKKIEKINDKYLEKIQVLEINEYDNDIKNISSKFDLENSNLIYTHKVQKRDIDTNNHMNNVIYLDLALEGLDDEFSSNISNIEIYYKTECKLNDIVHFVKNGDSIYILNESKEKLHTLVILK